MSDKLRTRWLPVFCLVNAAVAVVAGYLLIFVMPVGPA
jgi:hypothetical protein